MCKSIILLCLLCIFGLVNSKTWQVPQTLLNAQTQALHLFSSAGTQVIIKQKQIKQSDATNLYQLLQNTAGIHSYYNGNESTANMSMRGFGDNAFANMLILLNGFPLRTPDTNANLLDLIPITQTAYIQILPQTANVLYGGDAIGGVINIVTKKPSTFHAQANLGLGSYAGNSQAAAISGKKKSFHYSLSTKKLRSNNNRAHDQYHQASGTVNLDYTGKNNSIDFRYLNNVINEQYPGSIQKPSSSQRQLVHLNGFYIAVKHRINNRMKLNNHIEYRKINTSGYLGGNFLQNRYILFLQPELLLHFNNDVTTINGISMQDDRYQFSSASFSQFNRQLNSHVHDFFTHWNFPFAKQYQFITGARFAEQKQTLNQIKANHHAFISEQAFVYRPQNDWRFFIRRSGSYRFPKADEVGAHNTLLKIQTGVSYAGGLTWHNKNMLWQTQVYLINLDNEIAFAAANPNQTKMQNNRNLDPTKRLGLLLHGHYQVNNSLTLYANVNWVNAEYRSGPFKNKVIPMVSKETAKVAQSLKINSQISWYLAFLYNGGFYAAGDDNNKHYIGGYSLLNSSITYAWPHWSVALRVNNLLNREYSTYTVFSPDVNVLANYPAPGRNYWLTLSYHL